MAARPKLTKEQRRAHFLKTDRFVHNAVKLFEGATKAVASLCQHDGNANHKQTLVKMLHSILFMGNLHDSVYHPKEIFNEKGILNETRDDDTFRTAFEHQYQTHVPLKTPFSYFLELVVLLCGETNEDTVKQTLSETLQECEKSGDRYPLISTVICICKRDVSRYYGASLSCEDDIVREIMTAVSCVHAWHHRVASVVTSVFPEPAGTPRKIKLPDAVECTAYAVEDRNIKSPCMRCVELYSLQVHPDSTKENAPGNCAETEAISNLLKVDETCTITGGTYDERVIRQTMTACFDKKVKEKMNKRSKINQSIYNIDKVFQYFKTA